MPSKEKGEKKNGEAQCREEARREEYLEFMAKGLNKALDLDRRRSASPRDRQDPPHERSPRHPPQEEPRYPPTTNRRPVEVPPGLLPPTDPVDKNFGVRNTKNGPVDNPHGPPADMIPARPSSLNGACPLIHPQAPPAVDSIRHGGTLKPLLGAGGP
ncbi:unnamed protein product [Penicillium crustosum]